MATIPLPGGGDPLRALLDEIVSLQGFYVTREHAMQLVAEFDQDFDMILDTAHLPVEQHVHPSQVFSLTHAYQVMANDRANLACITLRPTPDSLRT